MIEVIESAMADGDSVGGIIECCATGSCRARRADIRRDGKPVGLHHFRYPGVRGIEFGTGFRPLACAVLSTTTHGGLTGTG